MEFKALRDVCAEAGIEVPEFGFLVPDERLFRYMLLQPRDVVSATKDGIGNTADPLKSKMTAFLKLIGNSDPDLALCPEYSCPWAALESALRDGIGPTSGKLWVLGCQSITPDQVRALRDRLPECEVLFDEEALQADGSFLDPAVIVFRRQDANQGLVLALQFKTRSMGGTAIERNSLICGRYGYFVHNGPSSIALAVLLCSDSLNFSYQHEAQPALTSANLLVHLQLNPKPRHASFAVYRSEILALKSDSVEIICLNWAAGSEAKANDRSFRITESHSAIYSKSSELDLGETRLQDNHERGLYFFRWAEMHCAVFVASFEELCFEIRATKPSQASAPAPTAKRTGPQDGCAYLWNGSEWSPAPLVEDCAEARLVEADLAKYRLMGSRMDLERFLCLSAGEVSCKSWEQPKNLAACRVSSDEVLSRTTCCANDSGRVAVETRLAYVKTLARIIQDNSVLGEDHLRPLQNTELRFEASDPGVNVYDERGPVATAAYIGDCVSEEGAKRHRQRMNDSLGNVYRRIYVWYRHANDLKCSIGTSAPTFSRVPRSSTSFMAPERPP